MTRHSETAVGKAFAENAALQSLIKRYDEEEKLYKRFLKKLTEYMVKYNNSKIKRCDEEEKVYKRHLRKLSEYTVKHNNSKKIVNKLAGMINDLKHEIEYK